MDGKDFDPASMSMPFLQAFLLRQAKLIEVYRSALEQLSTQSSESQTAGIQAALSKIDVLEAGNQSLKAQIADLHRQLAASEIQRENAHQQLTRLAPLRALYEALLANGALQATLGEDVDLLQERLLLYPDLKRQFDDALVYIASLEEMLRRKESESIEYQQKLAYVHNSISHRFIVSPIWKIRRLLLPDGSRRANAYFRMRQLPRRLSHGLQTSQFSVQQPQSESPSPTHDEPSAKVSEPQLSYAVAMPERKKTFLAALKIPHGSDIVFTIISKNYLANARALMESVRAIHPGLNFVTVLVDEIDGYFDPAAEPFQTLLASDLGIPNWRHFSMKYDIMELNTAVKPYAIQYLMDKFDAKRVIYFDPDILVYSSLDHIWELLNEYLCVLTPHITSSLDDNLIPSEVDFLKVGTYNLGFFAISQNGDWRKLLRWWQDRLYENCTREVDQGLFVDQHWMDLAPSLFTPTYILRDPAYNVAYWNLSHRQLEFYAGGYAVHGMPVVFFHFSGFSVNNPEAVSKYQNRFHFDNLNDATRACYLDYRRRLLGHGFEETSKYPYAYSRFDNGVPITDTMRICLRKHDSRGEIWPDPYLSSSPDSFLPWATMPGMLPPYRYLSPYAVTLYRTRPDLIAAFPDLQNSNEINFATWFTMQGVPEDTFDPVFIQPVQNALASGDTRRSISEPFMPSRRKRLARALHYYRNYPTRVKPYLPPQAFTETSVEFTGPMNAYGRTRNALQRMGILRISKRIVGMRLVMTAREYFNSAPVLPLNGSSSTASVTPEITHGVTVVGYLRAETGVGQIARNIISCLRSVEFPVNGYALTVGDIYRQHDESMNGLISQANRFIQIFAVNADQATVVRTYLGDNFYHRHYNIGYWFWELSDFPEIWKAAFEIYDEIWVATKFVQDTIQAKSSKSVFCIPPAILVNLPEQTSRAMFGLNDGDFVVLFVFDALSVVERKNPWAVIRAFESAFTEDERRSSVRLAIKVTNLDRVPEADRLRAEVARVNGLLIETYLDRLEVNALINHCDVYISLHRAEGYGLTMAEAMYLGKPVIGTAYSGNADFMNDDNSYPVPYRTVELGRTYPPYEAHNVWAEPDVDTAARYLREIYEDPESARIKGEAAARFIREYYSPDVRGEKIAARLKEIHNQYFVSGVNADDHELRH